MMAKTILLTGGSGVVGQALLQELTDLNVLCLTRQRPLQNDNIIAIPGNICDARLGLDTESYRALAARVDWVIHAAALTDFARPLAALRDSNVTGVRNMLAFANVANAPMLYVSTAFVQPRSGHCPNYYERSKREAEAVVRQSGQPVTIVRPSIVVGDSATGTIGKQQGIHRVMQLLLDGILPVVPGTADARIDFVPQDRVAEAIVGLVRHEIVGGDYWLTAGKDALSLNEGLEILAQRGSQLLQRRVRKPRLVAPNVFAAIMRQNPPHGLPAYNWTAHQQERVKESSGLFNYMTMGETFASSFAELGQRIDLLALPNPRITFARNLEYIVRYNQARRENRQMAM